ncbi:MAG: hypothetical protein JWP15_1182 [Alphaproteobacteria bacterium]|nr:hypothetical protein [Alphaproteobacteria bacterium]
MPLVSSSAVDSVDYDPESRILHIRYKLGDRYSYFEVPGEAYRQLLDAPSIGAFVNRRIKPNHEFVIERRRRRFRP